MEANNMEALNCPSCGSNELNEVGPAEYKCAHCGTGFKLMQAETGFVDVVLVEAGKKETDVILALREVATKEPTMELMDLATAKRLISNPPCVVVPNLSQEAGERVKARLEKAGATIELKPA
jgi:ribosomal protein L7/L12